MVEQIKLAVRKTLAYADIFSYPLTQDEIWRFLIWEEPEKLPSKNEFNEIFSTLKIKSEENYYYLSTAATIKERTKKELNSLPKIDHAKKVVQLLKKIPFIKLVGLSGTLAMNNSEINDDIDLFIVCQSNTVWLSRFLAIIILDLKGFRRKAGDRIFKDKICLNLFMDENFLEIPKNKQNLYTAHEIVQLRPIFSKGNIFQQFLLNNIWFKQYLPNAHNLSLTEGIKSKKQPWLLEIALSFINSILLVAQLFYMHPRLTKEVVSSHFAFFHPNDATSFVLEKYHNNISHLP